MINKENLENVPKQAIKENKTDLIRGHGIPWTIKMSGPERNVLNASDIKAENKEAVKTWNELLESGASVPEILKYYAKRWIERPNRFLIPINIINTKGDPAYLKNGLKIK